MYGTPEKTGSITLKENINGSRNKFAPSTRLWYSSKMNQTNSFLILLLALLIGGVLGMQWSKYHYDQMNLEPKAMQEYAELISNSQVGIQKEFLRFYMDDYCEGKHRAIDVKTMGVMWVGLYCDKGKVLILSDEAPHLPIATLPVDMETDTE